MLSVAVKNNLVFLLLALLAGFLISVENFSVIFLVFLISAVWFFLEKFETALMLLVLYLPFQPALNLSAGFDVASGRVLILALFGVWIFRSLKNRKVEVDFSLETIFLVLFIFLAVFSLGQVLETDRAIRKILVFLSIFPLYFVLTSLGGRKEIIMKILECLFLSGFVISLFGVLQFLAQFYFGINPLFDFFAKIIAPVFYGNTFAAEVVANPSWLVNIGGMTLLRSFSIFSDPHIFSFYIGLVAPLSFSAALFPEKAAGRGLLGNRKFVYSSFFLLVLAELFTFSRGGYMGMAAGFFVMICLFWKKFAARQKKLWAGMFIGVAILIFTAGNSVLARFFSSFDLSEGSNLERMKNWRQGWDVFSGNFFQGVGIGNYSFYMDPTAAYRTPIYAHNLYLDLGAELGVFALLAWIFLIAGTVWGLYISSRRTGDKAIAYLSVGLIGSLTWFSVHSLFDTSIYAPNILAMLVVILALSAMVIRYVRMER